MKTKLGRLLKNEFGNALKYFWVENDYLEKPIFVMRILIYGDYCEYVINNRVCSLFKGTSSSYYINVINKVLSNL